jgi:hypothetical protein
LIFRISLAVGNPDAVPYVRSLTLGNAASGVNRILAAFRAADEIPANDDVELTERCRGGVIVSSTTGWPPAILPKPASRSTVCPTLVRRSSYRQISW